MAARQNRAHELDYLGGKIYQAKELIGRLRESNRTLKSRLTEMERRLQSMEPVPSEATGSRPKEEEKPLPTDATNEELAAEVQRLRRERREIRERVSHLLERIETLVV